MLQGSAVAEQIVPDAGQGVRHLEAEKKAPSPRVVSDSEISTYFRALHFLKANRAMLVTEFGIFTNSKALHCSKALSPMLVTD